jgi:hypothetical protein
LVIKVEHRVVTSFQRTICSKRLVAANFAFSALVAPINISALFSGFETLQDFYIPVAMALSRHDPTQGSESTSLLTIKVNGVTPNSNLSYTMDADVDADTLI